MRIERGGMGHLNARAVVPVTACRGATRKHADVREENGIDRELKELISSARGKRRFARIRRRLKLAPGWLRDELRSGLQRAAKRARWRNCKRFPLDRFCDLWVEPNAHVAGVAFSLRACSSARISYGR